MQTGRDKFNKFKPIIRVAVKMCCFLPYRVRLKLFTSFRMVNGTKGLALRYVLLKSLAKQCGDNVAIHPHVYIFNPQNLSVGNNVSIHPMSYIECGDHNNGGIVIGDNVSIAHGVTLIATSHRYDDLSTPIKYQGILSKTVVIEDDVWIGAKATVLCGVVVKRGSIIGANSVVTKNVESFSIVGGNPAKILKWRGNDI